MTPTSTQLVMPTSDGVQLSSPETNVHEGAAAMAQPLHREGADGADAGDASAAAPQVVQAHPLETTPPRSKPRMRVRRPPGSEQLDPSTLQQMDEYQAVKLEFWMVRTLVCTALHCCCSCCLLMDRLLPTWMGVQESLDAAAKLAGSDVAAKIAAVRGEVDYMDNCSFIHNKGAHTTRKGLMELTD